MSIYTVAYNIRSTIDIEAESLEEAKRKFFDPDITTTEELFAGLQTEIGNIGNDAIAIDDIWEDKPL